MGPRVIWLNVGIFLKIKFKSKLTFIFLFLSIFGIRVTMGVCYHGAGPLQAVLLIRYNCYVNHSNYYVIKVWRSSNSGKS